MNEQERYVRELQRRLPFALGVRSRIIAEVREHLRDDGEDALARFGPVDELAAELGAELRIRAAARASWLVPALVVAFVFPLYVIPENTLPPAPWSVKPHYLAWKQQAAVAAFMVALGFGALAFAVGRVRPRLAAVPLACSLAALAVAIGFGAVVAIQWIDAVPGTSAALTYVGITASLLFLVALALLVADASRGLPHRRDELAPD